MNSEFWDERFEQIGNTGYRNQIIYKYDQSLRLKVIDKIVHRFQGAIENKSILDVGCGTGDFSILFAKKGANVIGIDITKKAIEKARIKAKGLSCIYYINSINDVDFKPQSFDVISSITVLQHIPDDHILKSIKKLVSCLKNGGYIYILETAPSNVDRDKAKLEFLYTRTDSEWIRMFESLEVKLVHKQCYPILGLYLIGLSAKLAKTLRHIIFYNTNRDELNKLNLAKDEDISSSLIYIRNMVIKLILFFSKPFDYYMPFLFRFGSTKIMVFKKVDK